MGFFNKTLCTFSDGNRIVDFFLVSPPFIKVCSVLHSSLPSRMLIVELLPEPCIPITTFCGALLKYRHEIHNNAIHHTFADNIYCRN